jgi:DNA-binding MarR family transcriptional regulator
MKTETLFGHHILIIEKCAKKYLRDAFRAYDLNTAEGMVLLFLKNHSDGIDTALEEERRRAPGGRTQEELIGDLHYDKGVMTRTMQSLETKGLVEREKNASDSRSYLFRLTPTGTTQVQDLEQIVDEWSTRLVDGLDDEALASLQKNLELLIKNALETLKG